MAAAKQPLALHLPPCRPSWEHLTTVTVTDQESSDFRTGGRRIAHPTLERVTLRSRLGGRRKAASLTASPLLSVQIVLPDHGDCDNAERAITFP